MKELLEQGIIGDLKLIRTSQNSFASRYDWQTLLYREGGAMRNNLAHSIEQIMDLASNDELPKIHSKLAIWNSVGDAEDYVHISIEYANGLLCELECNPADAYNDSPLFYLYSTRGTTKVFPTRILVKYYLDGESPISVLDHKSLHSGDGKPAYCSYSIVWHEEEITLHADIWNAFGKITNRFYHALYDHIFNGGELFMKPEHVKAQAAIMCEVERHNPLELKFDKPE